MSQAIQQAVVRTDVEAIRPDTASVQLALFDEDGQPFAFGEGGSYSDTDARNAIKTKTGVAALAAVSAANAAPAAGAEPTKAEYDALVVLANANKTAINAIIAALKA